MMPTLRLPNSPALAVLANAVANLADGEFRQVGEHGWIDIEFDGRLRLERSALLPASGREPDDEAWALLCQPPIVGRQVHVDDRELVVED